MEEKIREIVEKTLRQAQGDNSPILKNKGALIGTIIKETHGQADGVLVKKIVEEILV
jgi:Asp-tRNA(Asn)/Glu-tRNA(Gln) amidotransferase B subunit